VVRSPKLEALVEKRPVRSRSPVTRWLISKHTELSDLMSELGTDWILIAAYARSEGVKTLTGVDPTPDALRAGWLRVCSQMARKRRTTRVTPVATVVHPVAPSRVDRDVSSGGAEDRPSGREDAMSELRARLEAMKTPLPPSVRDQEPK
jgi:hypothetical protein